MLNATSNQNQKGFTLIELIIVIVLLGILSVVAIPRFIDISSDARIAALQEIAKQARSTTQLVQHKARIQGLRALDTNPNNLQSELIVDFGFGRSEVMYSNLCPESEGELGDSIDFLDFMVTSLGDNITTRVDNRYTLLGYDVPASGQPTTEGCYVIYDSFAEPDCTVEVVIVDC